ncbi:hypothetical protein H6784_03850 [Candidatus Nomurabacteria bacterium]|nr:hypothetical protein [Candidatus Kaiserbacteria bacterium]MCB9814523.1 hypothetical protein [Candidatus Nomurabacteria bacterium]
MANYFEIINVNEIMSLLKKYLPTALLVIPFFLLSPSTVSAGFFQDTLWALVNNVLGLFVGLAGMILDAGINTFVIGFGFQFLNTGVGVVVDKLWVNVRDIFNLTFIFGLIYIGFKMILNSDDSSTKRWLINLILAALLVNFSLYITKFIVDISNSLASQIALGGFVVNNGLVEVSTTLMSNFGITTLFGGGGSYGLPPNMSDGTLYGYIFGTALLYMVAIFVFAAGGLMLMIRYAALCLYMVLSPLMFLGWVFPQMQSVTSTYWKGFLGKSFFAPVYILLVYFSTMIIQNFFGTGGSMGSIKDFRAVLAGSGSQISSTFESTIPPFILSSIFLIASVVVANKLGADGAGAALRIGNSIKSKAQQGLKRGAIATTRATARTVAAPVAYGGGLAGRRLSYKVGSSLEKGLNRMQRSNNGAVRWVGSRVGMDDAVRDKAKSLKEAKFGLSNTIAEENKKRSIIDTRQRNNVAIEAGIAAEERKKNGQVLHNGQTVDKSSLTDADTLKRAEEAEEKTIATMQQTVAGYSATQLEEMMSQQPEQFEKIIGNIKSSDFDKMMDSDGLTQDQKAELLDARQKAIEASLTSNGKNRNEELTKLSLKQMETLGDNFIKENAHLFTKKQMDDLQKSDKFTDGQKMAQLTERSNLQKSTANDSAKVSELFTTAPNKPKKAIDIAQLSRDALLSDNALPYINGNVLEAIYGNNTLSADDREELKTKIKNYNGPANPNITSAQNYLKSAHGRLNWNNPEDTAPTPGSGLLDQYGRPIP